MIKKLILSVFMLLFMCQPSLATVSSAVSRMDYTGNGNVDTYPYTFKIFANTDLQVTIRDLDNIETTLSLTTDYTVSGVGKNSGGNLALVDSNQSWLDADGDLLSGYKLVIRRVRPLKQLADIRNQGQFFPETHENVFDHLVMLAQQQQDDIDRSIRLPLTVTGVSTELPNPTNDAYIGWNADSTGFVNKTPTSLTDSGPIINSGDAGKVINVNNAEDAYELSSVESIVEDISSGSIDFGTDVTVDGTLGVTGTTTLDDLNVGGNTVFSGTADFNGSADFTGQTITNLGTVTTSVLTTTDINGGTIDGAQIGNTVAVTGTFNAVYLAETTDKGTAANEGVLFTKDVSSTTQLFFRPNSNGTVEQISGSTNFQLFTGSGTFTPGTGVSKVFVSGCGGGGGGGGVPAGNANGGGGGGGGAGFSRFGYNVVAGNNYTVTIGAAGAGGIGSGSSGSGGTTIFNDGETDGTVELSAPGGAGGAASTSGTGGTGGAVGSLNGTANTVSTPGGYNRFAGGNGGNGGGSGAGSGGGSIFGRGGATKAADQNGGAAEGYCSGGAGAFNANSNLTGGAGAPGCILVEWF